MKIYDFPFAPNPRKLRIFLAEKGIEVPFEIVNLVHGEHREEPFLRLNPMGGVPILELDDGTILSESLAIIEYLDELYPEPPMIGRTPLERAKTRRLERIADLGVLGRVARYVHNKRSPLPHVQGDPKVAAQMLQELPKPLSVLEAECEGRDFLAGARPTIADCTLFAARAFGRAAELDLFHGYPNLQAWQDRMESRPSTSLPGF